MCLLISRIFFVHFSLSDFNSIMLVQNFLELNTQNENIQFGFQVNLPKNLKFFREKYLREIKFFRVTNRHYRGRFQTSIFYQIWIHENRQNISWKGRKSLWIRSIYRFVWKFREIKFLPTNMVRFYVKSTFRAQKC